MLRSECTKKDNIFASIHFNVFQSAAAAVRGCLDSLAASSATAATGFWNLPKQQFLLPILSAATAAASAINTTSRKFWVRFKGLSRGGALKHKFSDSLTHSASTALCVSLISQDFSSSPDTWLNPFTWHDSNFSCHGSHGLLLLTSCSDCAAIWFRRAISLSQWSCGISEHIEMESNLLPSTAAVAHLTLFSSTQKGVARNFWRLNQSCAAWPPYLVSVFSAGDYVATYQQIVCFPLWIFLCTS